MLREPSRPVRALRVAPALGFVLDVPPLFNDLRHFLMPHAGHRPLLPPTARVLRLIQRRPRPEPTGEVRFGQSRLALRVPPVSSELAAILDTPVGDVLIHINVQFTLAAILRASSC